MYPKMMLKSDNVKGESPAFKSNFEGKIRPKINFVDKGNAYVNMNDNVPPYSRPKQVSRNNDGCCCSKLIVVKALLLFTLGFLIGFCWMGGISPLGWIPRCGRHHLANNSSSHQLTNKDNMANSRLASDQLHMNQRLADSLIDSSAESDSADELEDGPPRMAVEIVWVVSGQDKPSQSLEPLIQIRENNDPIGAIDEPSGLLKYLKGMHPFISTTDEAKNDDATNNDNNKANNNAIVSIKNTIDKIKASDGIDRRNSDLVQDPVVAKMNKNLPTKDIERRKPQAQASFETDAKKNMSNDNEQRESHVHAAVVPKMDKKENIERSKPPVYVLTSSNEKKGIEDIFKDHSSEESRSETTNNVKILTKKIVAVPETVKKDEKVLEPKTSKAIVPV